MAKVDENGNFHMAGLKVGNMRFYQRNGKTFARIASSGPRKNNRTAQQTANRLLFSSARALWAKLKGALAGNFEMVSPGKSAYTTFMKLNHRFGVFMTKKEASGLCQVITPIQFSAGSLQPIEQHLDDTHRVVTDISLGSLEITPQTTIGELSWALRDDRRFGTGDELVFIAVQQLVQSGMEGFPDRPLCSVERYELRLDYQDKRPLQLVCGDLAFASCDGFLATQSELPAGCFGYCYVRMEGEGRKVSSQRLLNNNTEVLQRYTSLEKFEEARRSYGKFKDPTPADFELPQY